MQNFLRQLSELGLESDKDGHVKEKKSGPDKQGETAGASNTGPTAAQGAVK